MSEHLQIPTFYLYGEPHRLVGESFVHVEALDDRSRPSGWTIKPHAHAELCQIILIETGGGSMHADDRDFRFIAPSLLLIPATAVHGFTWYEESSGRVITMANRYVADLLRNENVVSSVFDSPRALELSKSDSASIIRFSADLMRELGWSMPGHRAAVDAAILSILVIALRNAILDSKPATKKGHHATIVARLRERVEERFRLRESITDHANALGISETALRVACAKVARASPSQIVDQRCLLEARRSLLYSNLSISQISYSLGFVDPAYFSRFFCRHIGVSPKQYRQSRFNQANLEENSSTY